MISYRLQSILFSLTVQVALNSCRNIMADAEENLAEEVSEFLCQSYEELPTNHLQIVSYFRGHSRHPVDGIRCSVFPVVTGSTAEFRINPMLQCVGDADIMYHYSCELAIPAGHQPPTQLPADFDSRIKVFDIVNSHVPGYVHLRLTYVVSKRPTDGKYIVIERLDRPGSVLSHECYVSAGIRRHGEIHGPSACMSRNIIPNWRPLRGINGRTSMIITDTVPCVRCLEWPTQAVDWPTRH